LSGIRDYELGSGFLETLAYCLCGSSNQGTHISEFEG